VAIPATRPFIPKSNAINKATVEDEQSEHRGLRRTGMKCSFQTKDHYDEAHKLLLSMHLFLLSLSPPFSFLSRQRRAEQ